MTSKYCDKILKVISFLPLLFDFIIISYFEYENIWRKKSIYIVNIYKNSFHKVRKRKSVGRQWSFSQHTNILILIILNTNKRKWFQFPLIFTVKSLSLSLSPSWHSLSGIFFLGIASSSSSSSLSPQQMLFVNRRFYYHIFFILLLR